MTAFGGTSSRCRSKAPRAYRACTTMELPPQLLALSKTLGEEVLKKQNK
jgi:hypothetical protein